MPGFEVNRFIDLSKREAKLLNCVICLNIFNNPIKSECEHTFCKDCVEQWIDSNKTTCPECRKEFTTRKRSHCVTSDDNLVIIGNHVFKRHLIVSQFVNELNTKCDFEFNGCTEVLEFGLLSAHLKQCEHRICKTCGLDIDKDITSLNDHNCVELLKTERLEMKSQIVALMAMIDSYEEIKQTKDEIKEMERKLSEMNDYMLSSLRLIGTKQSLPLVLIPGLVLFGRFKASVKQIQLNTHSIELKGIEAFPPSLFDKYKGKGIEISFESVQQVICCRDAILIKPIIEGSLALNFFVEDFFQPFYGRGNDLSSHLYCYKVLIIYEFCFQIINT